MTNPRLFPQVALYPPRPELSTLLGLNYRRVPVLSLGRDIFIDTSLIAIVLEKYFPPPQHPTIFPPRKGSGAADVGLQRVLSQFYADRALFSLGFGLVPWTKVPVALQEDRKKVGDCNFIIMRFDGIVPLTPGGDGVYACSFWVGMWILWIWRASSLLRFRCSLRTWYTISFRAYVIWSDACQLDFCGGSAQRRARVAYGYRGTGVHRYFCLSCSRMDPLIP